MADESFLEKLKKRQIAVSFPEEKGPGIAIVATSGAAGFLDKLKSKGLKIFDKKEASAPPVAAVPKISPKEAPAGTMPLDVDMYQTDSEILIYAKVPGTSPHDLDISTEGDNDIIIIRGKNVGPVAEAAGNEKPLTLLAECKWSEYYRRIVLPDEVNVTYADAKVSRGVLTLRLSLTKPKKGKRKIRVEGEE